MACACSRQLSARLATSWYVRGHTPCDVTSGSSVSALARRRRPPGDQTAGTLLQPRARWRRTRSAKDSALSTRTARASDRGRRAMAEGAPPQVPSLPRLPCLCTCLYPPVPPASCPRPPPPRLQEPCGRAALPPRPSRVYPAARRTPAPSPRLPRASPPPRTSWPTRGASWRDCRGRSLPAAPRTSPLRRHPRVRRGCMRWRGGQRASALSRRH